MKEEENQQYFGLIAETGESVEAMRGYEVSMDGTVVIPELCPSAPSERQDSSSIAGFNQLFFKVLYK